MVSLALKPDATLGHTLMLRSGQYAEGDGFYGPAVAYYGKSERLMLHTKAAVEAGVTEVQVTLGKHLVETCNSATDTC